MIYERKIETWGYTSKTISNLVREQFPSGSSDRLIQDILEDRILFKAKHYRKASQILGISLDELLSNTETTVKFDIGNENTEEVTEFLDKTLYLFREMVNQEKIAHG